MEITKKDLLERYKSLSTEELIELRARGTLTDIAATVLEELLESRGIKKELRENLTSEEQVKKNPVILA